MELQETGTDTKSARESVFIFFLWRIAQQNRILSVSISCRKIPDHSEDVADAARQRAPFPGLPAQYT